MELDWGNAAVGSFSMATYSASVRGDALGRQIAVVYFDMSQVGWVYWSDAGGVAYLRVFRGPRDAFFPRCQEELGLIFGD